MGVQVEQSLEVNSAGRVENATAAEQDRLPTEEELDAETQAMLEDIANSKAEVMDLLTQHGDTASVLLALKAQLTDELAELQQEAWRHQAYNELENMKQQLEAAMNLESHMDAVEAVLDAEDELDLDDVQYASQYEEISNAQSNSADDTSSNVDSIEGSLSRVPPYVTVESPAKETGGTASQRAVRSPPAATGTNVANVDDNEIRDIANMQAQLDEDLAVMMSQLMAIRSEATAVSARKAQLEEELAALIAQQVDAQEIDDQDTIREDDIADDVVDQQDLPEHNHALIKSSWECNENDVQQP